MVGESGRQFGWPALWSRCCGRDRVGPGGEGLPSNLPGRSPQVEALATDRRGNTSSTISQTVTGALTMTDLPASLARSRRALLAALCAVATLLGFSASAATGDPSGPGARAAVSAYVPERVIGAPSYPGVAAWGLAYNPVSDEMIVGDYVSRQVRRYTRAGVYLGDLRNTGKTIGGVASALGVDPRDGAIYVAVTGEGRTSLDVRKYDKDGNFLFDLDMPGAATWLTVDHDGNLWVPEGFSGSVVRKFTVDDASKSATLQVLITEAAPGVPMKVLTGAAADAAGNIYVADVGNKVIHSWTSAGQWRFDIGPSPIRGDLRGVAVDDELGRIYLSDAVFGGIRYFDMQGTYQGAISGLGLGDGEFTDGARQIAVTPDHHVWGADYGSFRVQEFAPDGAFVKLFPDPGMRPDPAGISQARGLDVDPVTGDVLTVDAFGQRVNRYAATGELLDQYGRRGSSPPEGMNYPKAVAVDPSTRDVWISSFEGPPGVVGYSADFATVLGRPNIPRWVGDLEFFGGKLYALERRPGAVRVINTSTMAVERTWTSPVGLLHGLAIDPANGNLWITHDSKPQLLVVNPAGRILRTITLPGVGWGVAIKGDEVAVANTSTGFIDLVNRVTYKVTGKIGVGNGFKFGQLKTPSGLQFGPDGKLYVIEQVASRVTVFGPGPSPAPETVKPKVTFGADAPVVNGQIVLTGSATDASGIALIEARVRDLTTGRYYDGRAATYVTAATWSAGVVWGELTQASWRYTVPATLPGRSYAVWIRATDRRGNLSLLANQTIVVP